MNEQADLDEYNGDAVHDMWVDFDNYENTDIPNVFDESLLDECIKRLNWCK